MDTHRNHSIDVIKGFLILCVILGHILLGTADENRMRFFLYSFHMPLFMFMSGYMMNLSKLTSLSYHDVFSKYWKRMLKMWSIALVVFSFYQLSSYVSIRHLLELLYSPWYHLWYVPTLFVYIIVCRFLFANFPKVQAYALLLVFFLAWYFVPKVVSIPMPRWCVCTHLPYFALGLFCKNDELKIECKPQWLLPLIYTPLLFSLSRIIPSSIFEFVFMPVLFVMFLYFVVPCIKWNSLPNDKVLCYVGRNSLNIYLWHMIPIMLLRDYVSDIDVYYIISFSLLLVFLLYVAIKGCKKENKL